MIEGGKKLSTLIKKRATEITGGRQTITEKELIERRKQAEADARDRERQKTLAKFQKFTKDTTIQMLLTKQAEAEARKEHRKKELKAEARKTGREAAAGNWKKVAAMQKLAGASALNKIKKASTENAGLSDEEVERKRQDAEKDAASSSSEGEMDPWIEMKTMGVQRKRGTHHRHHN